MVCFAVNPNRVMNSTASNDIGDEVEKRERESDKNGVTVAVSLQVFTLAV